MIYTIHNKDITEYLNETDEMYHAVLSDPPYGLAFMGKAWDKYTPLEYQQWVTEWGKVLLDRLYPGAVCMFFGGTRTYHRLATGLEDAGFEIFDSMIWVYGSGFPKSHNISKAIDKSMGLEREIVGVAKGVRNGNNQNIDYGDFASATDGNYNLTKLNHQLAQQWNGYGTALKPAYEPIVLCRKPRNDTFANLAIEHGTGALNIDGGRIGTEQRNNPYTTSKNAYHGFDMCNGGSENVTGRFPANFGLICECGLESCECVEKELDNQSGISLSNGGKSPKRNSNRFSSKKGMFTKGRINTIEHYLDKGGASRFFYTAKASRKERNLGIIEFRKKEGWPTEQRPQQKGNNHPTVKPLKLTEYLATLLLPPTDNAKILIPFSGSGSEMIGASLAGWQDITGIELNSKYIEIAEKRLEYWTKERETIHP